MRLEDSITIQAPPEAVWPHLVEPEKVLVWCSTFLRFEYIGDERPGIGTRLVIEERVPPMHATMGFEIVRWLENQQLNLRMRSGSPLKRYEQSWSLVAHNGGSRFTFAEEIELPFGPLGRFFVRLSKGRSEVLIRHMLATLKHSVESAMPAKEQVA